VTVPGFLGAAARADHRSGKSSASGSNYRDHAEEANQPSRRNQPIFAKWSNAILDPNEPI